MLQSPQLYSSRLNNQASRLTNLTDTQDPTQYEKLSQIQVQYMRSLMSSSTSTGILEISNMKMNYPQWQRVFIYLRYQMPQSHKSSCSNQFSPKSLLKTLCLINNRKPTILKTIEFISFPSLTKLSLDGNKIHSIEAIQFMHLPSLRQLFLYRNSITSFKPLGKCSWPDLYLLSVYDNFDCEIKAINRMQHQVSRLWLEGEGFRVQGEDVSYMVKFKAQSNRLNQLGIKSKQRILQPILYDKLKQKHSKSVKIMHNANRGQEDEVDINQQQH